MRRNVLLLAFVVAFAAAARLHVPPKGELIKDHYIVVFKENLAPETRAAHIKEFQNHGQLHHTYDINTFHGFAGKMNSSALARQLLHSNVAFVEQDQVMRASQSCTTQTDSVWGLDRITERDIFLDGEYIYNDQAGSGVDAYIVDTGIMTTHNDFGGRAIWGSNHVDNTTTDCNGHGTHVAGTVGGTEFGVAKKVTLIAVKVLNCAGSGTNAGVIAGVNWVSTSARSRGKPSVANMSLGGGLSTALNNAVAAVIAGGVSFAVAAGNENADACNSSPASTSTAITVGATTVEGAFGSEEDLRSTFSNFGTCVHIFAPGQLIESAWIGSNTRTNTISGTSMASPHVCGAAAMYLSINPTATPAQIKSFFVNQATTGLIDLGCTSTACRNSPNRLLHSVC